MSMTFPIVLTPRQEASRYLRWFSPLLALILTVLTGGIIFASLGTGPVCGAKNLFCGTPWDSSSWLGRSRGQDDTASALRRGFGGLL